MYTSVSRFRMEQPCAYTMKKYEETSKQDAVDVASSEEGTQCTIQNVVKELSRNGIEVVKTVTSPKGDLFLLLGVNDQAVQAKTKKAVKASMQNDAELRKKMPGGQGSGRSG